MRIRRLIWIALFTVMLAALTGCAGAMFPAETSFMPVHPLESGLNAYSTLKLSFEPGTGVFGTVENPTSVTGGLYVATVLKLRALGLFKTVELDTSASQPPGTLTMKVTILGVSHVDDATRFMAGLWAGRASLAVSVDFIDRETGKTLGSYAITGRSSAATYSSDSQAVRQVADAIAAVIANGYHKQ